jgi:hypothetical protein
MTSISPITKTCRFCYSYQPSGTITQKCVPLVCATDSYLSNISNLMPVVNNNTQTTERSLLLQQQALFLQEVQTNSIVSTVEYTLQNSSIITSTLYGELLGISQARYLPYQRLPPMCPPSSVIQLQMQTANVGVPHSVFTIANCKGNQFVTT